ncbi:hypothetical protein RKD49_006850 [Streptomyces glaucescens]
MHHQLDHLGAVAAVGLAGEGEADGADQPVPVVRRPDGELPGGDLGGPLPPPGRGLGGVERAEEADGGAARHGVGQQLRELVGPLAQSAGVQPDDGHGSTTAST